jgi:hypothetical protein
LGNAGIAAANPISLTFTILGTSDARKILVIDPNGGSFTVNRVAYFTPFGTVVNASSSYVLPNATNSLFSVLSWRNGDTNGTVVANPYLVTEDSVIVAKWS